MATLRNLVSTIRGTHKLLTTDGLASDRLIASEIKNCTFLLIKRETNLRKLWSTSTIFTTIDCLEMKEVPISECCDFVDPCTVARTVHKLPRISEGNYQYLIQGVYSINVMSGSGKRLKEITINRYVNLLKLPVIKNEEYYWIVNGYLYCNNPSVKALRMAAFFEEDVSNDILFSDCNCGNKASLDELCKNPLDKEFGLPGYLEKQVLDLTSQRLLNTYFKLKTDQTQENIDGQAPNTQPTN